MAGVLQAGQVESFKCDISAYMYTCVYVKMCARAGLDGCV